MVPLFHSCERTSQPQRLNWTSSVLVCPPKWESKGFSLNRTYKSGWRILEMCCSISPVMEQLRVSTSWWLQSLSSLAAGSPIRQLWPSWSSGGPALPWQCGAEPVPGLASHSYRSQGTRCRSLLGTDLKGERINTMVLRHHKWPLEIWYKFVQ